MGPFPQISGMLSGFDGGSWPVEIQVTNLRVVPVAHTQMQCGILSLTCHSNTGAAVGPQLQSLCWVSVELLFSGASRGSANTRLPFSLVAARGYQAGAARSLALRLWLLLYIHSGTQAQKSWGLRPLCFSLRCLCAPGPRIKVGDWLFSDFLMTSAWVTIWKESR